MTDEERRAELERWRNLKIEYANDLIKVIKIAFSDYNLDFEWRSGWVDDDDPLSINYTGDITIKLVGVNDEIVSEIKPSDRLAFNKFVEEIIKNFMSQNSNRLPDNDSLEFEIVNVYFNLFKPLSKEVLKIGIMIDDNYKDTIGK